jgi:hypothetical protein
MAAHAGSRRPGRRHETDPVRITTAATSHADDLAQRRRRYVVSMAIRTACVIGAVAVGDNWLRWVLVAGAVFLPYVAVVMANAGDTRDDAFDLPDTGYQRSLPPGVQGPAEDPHDRT